MATHKLLLLPGDGIGPEVMAEVKKLIAWMNAHGMGTFETEEGLVGGCCYDAHKVAITDDTMAKAHAADAVIFGAVGGPKWDKRALRRAAGGGAAAAAQGARPVRQHPAGDLLPGARRRFEPQARGGRRARHHHPARAHRRRLFRRAQDHHRSRQRPEARGRHPGLRHLRDRAHLPRRLRARAQAAQQGHLDGEAQRDEDRRALERGGQPGARARVQGRAARASARRRRRHAARALAQAVRRDRHRQPVRRHALRRRRDAHRLARHAAVGLARRGRSQDQEAQGDVRAGARLGARHRRQGHRQSDRDDRLLRHGAALLVRSRARRPT